jgi:multisubunit Na+/H+ antiporter MnhB subunit
MHDLSNRWETARAWAVSAWEAFRAADAANGGLPGIALAAATIILLVLALPTRRGQGGAVWPRVWACGALGGVAMVMLILPR